jgi:Phosphotransferase enzyme family
MAAERIERIARDKDMELLNANVGTGMAMSETAPEDCYELVLFDRTGTRVLLWQDNNSASLPVVHIRQFTRIAEQITSSVKRLWGITTVLLWSERAEAEDGCERLAVLEVIEGSKARAGLDWFEIQLAVTPLGKKKALRIDRCRAKAIGRATMLEPFSRLGWFYRLRDWVSREINLKDIEPADFVQLNGSGAFCLLKFQTDSTPLWFKAVGAPNLREFPITLLLSRLFPTYLPPLLASEPVLNGWLMESGGDLTLFDCPQMEVWMEAVRRLAEMQIHSRGRTSELLQAGCHDLRLETLNSLVPSFFQAMAHLMAGQKTPSPPPLTIEDISDLARNVQEALTTMIDCCDAETLGHSDFNPGNILVDGERIVFTDWAEAYVGWPFLTFEFFLAHLSKSRPGLTQQEDYLREASIKPWLSLISRESLRRALDLSPLIGPYAYAINAWRDPRRLANPQSQDFLRSLARRMKREADYIRSKRHQHPDLGNGYSTGTGGLKCGFLS